MKELLLLATERIDTHSYYLYTMEMKYQKVIKVLKTDGADDLSSRWKIGFITSVENLSKYSLDNNVYVTGNEYLKEEYNDFIRLMLNKASYPDRILSMVSGLSQAIIRLRQIKIVDQAKSIAFVPWGTNITKTAQVLDPWWNQYWKKNYSCEKAEYYEVFLSKNKKKVFALVESEDSQLTVKKLLVL